MMFGLFGIGDSTQTDPYAGTDALGPATVPYNPNETGSAADTTSGSNPGCTPGTANCVPHWYCYIPLMATPDCLASFAEGTGELAQAGGQAVGATVSKTVQGAVTGVAQGLANPNNNNPSAPGLPFSTGLMLAAIGGIAALVMLKK